MRPLPAVELPEELAPIHAHPGVIEPHRPWHVVDDFFDDAEAMRAEFDAHFATPYAKGPDHQVWDYWHVPGQYTYLRTRPDKVLAPGRVQAFLLRLRQFAVAQLGLSVLRHPFLSLYVDGCVQGLHNDAGNGAMAYVHSLTRWESRRFEGGETQVFHQVDYWRDGLFRVPGAGARYFDLIPSLFNRLVLFDDRLAHAVPELHGSMDPSQGRVVIHGHLMAGGLLLQGGAGSAATPALDDLRDALNALVTRDASGHDGVMTLRCPVTEDGEIGPASVLLDRVFDGEGRQAVWPGLVPVLDLLGQTRLPAGPTGGLLTVPLPLLPET